MRRPIRLQRSARQRRWFDVPGWPIAGWPIAGLPIAGLPIAGLPIAGLPIAGLPIAGLLVTGWLVFSGASRRSAAEEKQAVDKLPEAAAKRVDYGRDIEPLLRRSCYSCHGPDKQEGGLRLDDRARARLGGDSGASFVVGNGAASQLIHRVAGLDEDERMPPAGEGTPLSAEEVGLLRAWIDQGVAWPDDLASGNSKTNLWALRPITMPAPPAVQDPQWTRTAMDRFILARLDREGVRPSGPADRTTLARRAYLDLLGLPPSPDELSELLADERPDWYERLIDRLLASPHFGERWGRHWLDLARYADSDGYEKDRPRPHAWRYREWVLEAINADLPYDQFTIAQLAGDVLDPVHLDQRIASGFHRNTLHNTEGGADQEEDRVKKTVDRTNTLGTIWLGLTVGCAQCHSHKYDPLTQREYYQLFAFFNNLEEQDVDAPLPWELARYQAAKQRHDEAHAPVAASLADYERNEQPAVQAAWEKNAAAQAFVWSTLETASTRSQHGAELQRQPDGSILAQGPNVDSEIYTVEATTKLTEARAIRLEVLPDDRLPAKGPGRADHGNFVLTQLTVEGVNQEGVATPVPLVRPQADFSQGECDVALAINGNSKDFWAIAPQMGKRHVAVFAFQEPVVISAGARFRITLDQTYGRNAQPHNLGRFRLSVSGSTSSPSLEGWPAEVVAALRVPVSERSPEQAKQVAEHFRPLDPEWLRRKKAVEEHAKQAPSAPGTKAQTVAQRGERRPTRILVRGDFLNPGEEVSPATPGWLPPLNPRSSSVDRVDLARWVASPTNPLTPRVTANRVWERIFGRGIVATSDDFGRQGDPPSHPELLDWLAAEFVRHGWSLKRLLRQIVTSETYRLSSTVRADLEAVDPENVWLARQTRRRVEAEVIRDLALAASGLLDPRLGGPSVRPPQPAEYSNLTYANSVKWVTSTGGDRYRRGLYTFFQRTSPYPMLMTFDSPDSNECCARRDASNTPLQALTLWNDPAFFECSQEIGRRIVRDVPPRADGESLAAARAEYAIRICLSRPAVPEETAELVALFHSQQKLAEANPPQASQLIGAEPLPPGTTAAELAAWILVGRTLLNLDEFVTRE